MNGPCYGCPDRCPEPNCHMTCDKYLAYQMAKGREHEKMMRAKHEDSIGNVIQYRRIKAVIKERNRK